MTLAAIATIIIPPSLSPSYHTNVDTYSGIIRDSVAEVLHYAFTFEGVRLIEAHANEEFRFAGYNSILAVALTPDTKISWSVKIGADKAIERVINRRTNGRLKCLTSLTTKWPLGALSY